MGQGQNQQIGEPARRQKRVRRSLQLLLGAFVLLASIYSIVNPLYEGTDELRHFRFVRVLAETGKLPVQGQEPRRSQSHHPPLYYALSAALTFWLPNQGDPYLGRPENPFWGYRYWEVGADNKNMYLHAPDEAFPWSGAALAAHIARFVNVVLGAVAVALTAGIVLTIFPRRPALAYGAAGLMAFNPMFLYLSGAANNDVVAAATGAAVTLACLLVLRDGLTTRWMVALGTSFGLALMAKFSLVSFLPILELVILYRSTALPTVPGRSPEGGGKSLWRFIRANLLVLGLAGVIAGWWFIRNQVVYGDPTGFREVTELWGVRSPWESFGLAWSELPNVWSSLWGRFGYGQIPLPQGVYRALAWAAGLGGLGLLLGISRMASRNRQPGASSQSTDPSILQLALLLLVALAAFATLFAYMLVSPAGSMGRFFFPGLPAFAALVFYGWSELVRLVSSLTRHLPGLAQGGHPADSSAALALIGNLALFTFAVWVLVGFLAPAYAVPGDVPVAEAPENLGVTLSDPEGPLVRLLGYRMDADSVRPGESLDITFAWQTIRPASSNYVVFVHLLDEIDIVIAQRDTYPGLGNYPTSHWRPGHTFLETYRLQLPQTAYAPNTLTPQVGLYSRDWPYRLETGTADNAVKLPALALDPLPGELPNPQQINFGDQLQLVGYRITPRTVRPGEKILFQLYWQVERPPDQNYGIFLHVMGEENRIWAGYDRPPRQSMQEWPLHSPIEEQRLLTMPEEMPAGVYPVEIGVWPVGTDEGRLPILAEDGHWIDHLLLLSPIRLLPSQ
jgi:4-amino-4-deoxy-L-arabinose transferase-like glycosyltransferase